MKRTIIVLAALILSALQGVWAQTVNTASALSTAVQTNNASIVLGENILLSSYLNINGVKVTIDLNGYKLYRNISGSYASDGHVIYVHNNARLAAR